MPRLFPFIRCGVHDSAGHLNACMAGVVGSRPKRRQAATGRWASNVDRVTATLRPSEDEVSVI
jgi:hypothetical protein